MKATTTSIPQCGTPRTPRSAISEQTDSGRDVTSEPSPASRHEAPDDDYHGDAYVAILGGLGQKVHTGNEERTN